MALPEGFTLEAPASSTSPVSQGVKLPAGFQLEAPIAETSIRQNVGAEAPRRSYQASEIPGAAYENFPRSGKEAVAGLYQAATHPLDTLETLRQVIGGGAYNALPAPAQKFVMDVSSDPERLRKSIATADAVGGMYKERYGDWDKVKRTLAEDPVGAITDLSTLFSGGAAAASKAGLVKTAAGLTTAANLTNPLNVVTKPVEMYAKSKNALLQTQKEANVVRDANLLAAQKEGYIVTPGSLDPTGANVVKERIAGKTHLEQLASIKNQATTDNLARKAAGLPENAALTPSGGRVSRPWAYFSKSPRTSPSACGGGGTYAALPGRLPSIQFWLCRTSPGRRSAPRTPRRRRQCASLSSRIDNGKPRGEASSVRANARASR